MVLFDPKSGGKMVSIQVKIGITSSQSNQDVKHAELRGKTKTQTALKY